MEPDKRETPTPFARLGELARSLGTGQVSKTIDALGERRAVETFARARSGPFRSRWAGFGVAVAMMAAAVVISSIQLSKAPLSWTVDGSASTDIHYVSPPPGKQALVRFSEGSEFGVQPGSRLRIAEVGRKTVKAVLETGTTRVQTSGHSIGWKIDVGPFSVSPRAMATLIVEWLADELLCVKIFEGEASVDGTPSPLFLHAGQQVSANARDGTVEVGPLMATAEAPPSPSAEIAKEVPEKPSPSGQPAAVAPAVPALGAGKRSTWSDEVAAGDYASVVLDAERRGLASVMADGTLADLVALADAARLSGRIDLARRTLLAQRSRFARTSAAKDAAFFLGRIADDHERALDSAIGWYDTYLSEAPAGHFAAEAFGRKMVAVSKQSGRAAAKATAGEYLKRFPSGPHATLARELLTQ
jgi:TolA-binding protein